MMKITGLSHLFKWENLHNWWLTKYFFAPLYILKFMLWLNQAKYNLISDICSHNFQGLQKIPLVSMSQNVRLICIKLALVHKTTDIYQMVNRHFISTAASSAESSGLW